MRSKALLIGYCSKKTITGASIAYDTVLYGFKQKRLDYRFIDLSNGNSIDKAGEFNFIRALYTLKNILQVWFLLPGIENVYIIISTSLWGFFRDFLLIFPSMILSKRIILHLHGGGYLDFYIRQPKAIQKAIKLVLTNVETIIVEGKLLLRQFEFLPTYPNKLIVVPNGLPYNMLPEKGEPKRLSSPVSILYMSNLIESKGYLDVLAACKILHHDYKIPVICHFCGSFVQTIVSDETSSVNELKNRFIDLIHEWGLDDIVKYHGNVYGNYKKEIFAEANILVLPTYYPWEGQPISIIEALAYGIPVITTNFKGIPELVVDNYNGYLIKPKSPIDIAKKIAYLWKQPDLYFNFSKQSKEDYLRKYTTEKFVDSMASIIFNRDSQEPKSETIKDQT